jgi:hypothetical protein
VVALTYQAMGLLPDDRHPSWYDPGRFWSGDDLALEGGAALGGEIAVDVPAEMFRNAEPGRGRRAGTNRTNPTS